MRRRTFLTGLLALVGIRPKPVIRSVLKPIPSYWLGKNGDFLRLYGKPFKLIHYPWMSAMYTSDVANASQAYETLYGDSE